MAVYNIDGNNLEDIVFDIYGETLLQAYDINQNPLLNGSTDLQIVPDSATGTPSGYVFTLVGDTGHQYRLMDVVNLLQYDPNLQSFGYDSDNNLFYEFDEIHRVNVFDSTMQKIETFYVQDLDGHCNDCAYYNGKFYFPDVDAIQIRVLDLTTRTASIIPVSGINQPNNGSIRTFAAICKIPDNNDMFYLVCADYGDGAPYVHKPDDKISVYLYSLSTHVATLQAEYQWDCSWLQGCEVYDGILYAVLNNRVESGASTGVTLKAFRTDTWRQLSSMITYGSFEPEGLSIYPYSSDPEFMTGIGEYLTMSEIVRFSIPYRIIN